MAEAAFAGAAVGTAFAALYDVIKVTVIKNAKFKPISKEISGTVEALKPLIDDIIKFNKQLDLPPNETSGFDEKLKKGADLLVKCSKVHRCNFCVKPHYFDELQELDASLNGWMDILKVQHVRDVKKDKEIVRQMHQKVFGNEGNQGANNRTTLTANCDVPDKLPSLVVGLDGPLEELKKRLLSSGESLLVVTGLGGSGKTLLAQKFCHDPLVKGRFNDNIFFVTVSKPPPSVSDIVQQLYKRSRHNVPNLIDEAEAVNHLEILLNKIGGTTPILLVLDDVWAGSESLVQKFVFQRPEFKILVTSRCELQGFGPPDFAPSYHLNPLNDKNARTLFCHWASLEDGNSGISDLTVNKIVDYYKISSRAIKIVGQSLYEKPVEFWQRKLGSLSSRLSSESELLACLQSSLDALNVKLKECFIDLGSFPEDQRIPAPILIDMWMELYELNEETDAIVNLFNLTTWNLANLVITREDHNEKDGYYSEHFVTQPCLLRDLANHQSSQDPVEQRERLIMDLSGDKHPKWWKEHKEQQFNTRLLSISTDEKFSSKWFNMKLPKAEVLVLNFRSKDYALPKFVEEMENLKVLIVTNYSSIPADLRNFQLLGSLEDLRRIRLEHISIPSLSLVSLENLQKISFYNCNIDVAFSNCSTKISDLFPNLTEMNMDFCNDLVELPAEICDIETLEKLTISHCPNLRALPEEIGNLENLKGLRLRSCNSLVGLPDSICKLSNITFLDISDCNSIESLPEDIGNLRNLSKLNMKHCSSLQELPWSVSSLTRLEDVICDGKNKELWKPFLPNLPHTTIRSATSA
ncbi:hypothetical protein FNV43_RR17176 [Rhamnella rubrinervis]|uniref:RPW8 domain-containing protein n=1 Tax=Rhamnella rubrinervis TaxID=2594499 RepID=A0A8K0E238_9ROSA|nr:hypothetical protein FNV43_RR17176 [Rhamnella rubrinervis]